MADTKTLISQLGDPRRSVRRDSEKELVKLGQPAVPALIETLEEHHDPELWRMR